MLYTLSKCREPLRLGEMNRHVVLSQPALSRMVALAMTAELNPDELRQLKALCRKLTR